MSADLLVQYLDWGILPEDNQDWEPGFNRLMAEIERKIEGLKTLPPEPNTGIPYDEDEVGAEELAEFKTRLRDLVKEIRRWQDRRDATIIILKGRALLVTGGMSSSEDPTELYGLLAELIDSGMISQEEE